MLLIFSWMCWCFKSFTHELQRMLKNYNNWNREQSKNQKPRTNTKNQLIAPRNQIRKKNVLHFINHNESNTTKDLEEITSKWTKQISAHSIKNWKRKRNYIIGCWSASFILLKLGIEITNITTFATLARKYHQHPRTEVILHLIPYNSSKLPLESKDSTSSQPHRMIIKVSKNRHLLGPLANVQYLTKFNQKSAESRQLHLIN